MTDRTKGTGTHPRTKKGTRRQDHGSKRYTQWDPSGRWGPYEEGAPRPKRKGR